MAASISQFPGFAGALSSATPGWRDGDKTKFTGAKAKPADEKSGKLLERALRKVPPSDLPADPKVLQGLDATHSLGVESTGSFVTDRRSSTSEAPGEEVHEGIRPPRVSPLPMAPSMLDRQWPPMEKQELPMHAAIKEEKDRLPEPPRAGDGGCPCREALDERLGPLLEKHLGPMLENLQATLKAQYEPTHVMMRELRSELLAMQTPVAASRRLHPQLSDLGSSEDDRLVRVVGTLAESPHAGLGSLAEEAAKYDRLGGLLTGATWDASPREKSSGKSFGHVGSHFEVYHASTAHLGDDWIDLGWLFMTNWKEPRQWKEVMMSKFGTRDFLLSVLSLLIILGNCVFIGIMENQAVELALTSTTKNQELYLLIETLFTVLMVIELMIRVFFDRGVFMDALVWNLFDTFLIFVGVMEVVLQAAGMTSARCLNFVRVLRLVRLVRIIPKLRTLRVLFAMIGTAVSTFGWAMMGLLLFVYMYAIVVTQRLSLAIPSNIEDWSFAETDEFSNYQDWEATIQLLYGSIPRTVTTMLGSISGGRDWLDAARPLVYMQGGSVMYISYIGFVFSMVFCLSNILIAMMVESTNDVSKLDREIVIDTQVNMLHEQKQKLLYVFSLVDQDKSGTVTRDEMHKRLRDPRVNGYLQSIDITMSEVWGVFNMLDKTGSGSIELALLARTLLTLRGNAKNVDLVTLIHAQKRCAKVLDTFQRDVTDKLNNMEQAFQAFQGMHKARTTPFARHGTEGAGGSPPEMRGGR